MTLLFKNKFLHKFKKWTNNYNINLVVFLAKYFEFHFKFNLDGDLKATLIFPVSSRSFDVPLKFSCVISSCFESAPELSKLVLYSFSSSLCPYNGLPSLSRIHSI